VLGFSGARAAVEWQLDRARSLGITELATLDYEARLHAPDLPPPQRVSVLPSRLVETLGGLGDVPFVCRVANGVIQHRGPLASPQSGRRDPARREPASQQRAEPGLGAPSDVSRKLMDRVKATFDPGGLFPDYPL
jgi:hypothetical protein